MDDYTSLACRSESQPGYLQTGQSNDLIEVSRGDLTPSRTRMHSMRMTTMQRIVWVLICACLAAILYVAFRGYLTPALLIDFANGMLC